MTQRLSADDVARLARALDTDEPVTFVRHFPEDDAFMRGTAMLLVPGLFTTMPPRLLAAVRVRRAATLSGWCPACSASVDLAASRLMHRADCLASDPNLTLPMREWERRVGKYGRGQRIREMP